MKCSRSLVGKKYLLGIPNCAQKKKIAKDVGATIGRPHSEGLLKDSYFLTENIAFFKKYGRINLLKILQKLRR